MTNAIQSTSVSDGGFCKLFTNDLFKVRVVMRDDAPWFVAKDVAASIEHKDVSTMCKLCRIATIEKRGQDIASTRKT